MSLRQRRKPIIPIDIVKDFDAFVKVENDFKQQTTTGGTSRMKFFYFLSKKEKLSNHSFHFSFCYYYYCYSCFKSNTYCYISK